MTTASLIKENI
jgi:hypothetical protein